MKTPTDPQTNATLLALGLLSDAEARTVAASVHQNMPQRLQAAAVQDIATALLLSGSSPAVTPPPAVLASIQKRVAQSQRRRKLIAGGATALRWSGWGAAAAMALLLARTPESPQQAASATTPVTKIPANSKPVSSPNHKPANSSIASADLQKEVQALRNEVATLRAQVTSPDDSRHRTSTVSVLSYSRNGKATPLNSILPSGSALASVVATALKPYLVKQGSNPSVGPEIVIEQGFGAFTASTLPEGYYFRHQHFPTEEWQSLGLLSGSDGSYYDPNGQLLWQPDPTNPGSYIGYVPEDGADLSRFNQSTNNPPPLIVSTSPNSAAPLPQNFSPSPSDPPTASLSHSAIAPLASPPQIIAVIDTFTKEGRAIITPAKASTPGTVPVPWSTIIDPTSGQPITKRIGVPIFATIGPNDLPKVYQLKPSDLDLLNNGRLSISSELASSLADPNAQPTTEQTIISSPTP